LSELKLHQEIKSLLLALDTAWNKNDAQTFASFYTEKAVQISPLGLISNGKRAIKLQAEEDFSGALKGSIHKLSISKVYELTNNHAVSDGTVELQLSNKEVFKVNFTAVFSKESGNWLISHMRSYVYYQATKF
jgi:uncharacterized protein (TIGR02246 family)